MLLLSLEFEIKFDTLESWWLSKLKKIINGQTAVLMSITEKIGDDKKGILLRLIFTELVFN